MKSIEQVRFRMEKMETALNNMGISMPASEFQQSITLL